MAGFSPSMPIRRDGDHGFALTQSMVEVIRQNLRNLLLTNPGERMMIPDFGVGIKRFLFEMDHGSTYGNINSAIESQVEQYLPFIKLLDVTFDTDPQSNPGALYIKVIYEIQPLELTDGIELTVGLQA